MKVNQNGRKLAAGILVVVMLGNLAGPIAGAWVAPVSRAYAAQPFPTVVPQQSDFENPFPEEAPEPVDFANYLLNGDLAFPFGDEFLGEPEMKLAGIQQDLLGRYGMATISESPDHRLIWVTDESGVRHNLIVHEDVPLYVGGMDSCSTTTTTRQICC